MHVKLRPAGWRGTRLGRLLPAPALLLAVAASPMPANASSCSVTSPPDISAPNVPASGPVTGGTNVTITGDNFTKVAGVDFGPVPATSFTVVTCNQIVAVSPPGVMTVDVSVSTAAGTSATTALDHFTYGAVIPGTQPTVKSVSPSSGSAGGGSTVTVIGSGFAGPLGNTPPSVQFGGVAATGVVVQSDSQLTATSPSQNNSGWVDVTVTTIDGGTSSTSSGDRFTYFPVVTTVAPATGGTNGGTAVTIIGNGFGNAGGAAGTVTFGGTQVAFTVSSPTQISAISPARHSAGAVDVQATVVGQSSPLGVTDQFTYRQGLWITNSAGVVTAAGAAQTFGNAPPNLQKPIVGITATPSGNGYWLVAGDGGVFPFGDAGGYGSLGGVQLNHPIVGMAATPDGRGYWLVSDHGNVNQFGDANWYGDIGGIVLNKLVSGIAAAPNGGYWIVARDGGIWPFPSSNPGYCSLAGQNLVGEIIAITSVPHGGWGFWQTGSDGGEFPCGPDAHGYGALGAAANTVVAQAATPDAGGYWMLTTGGVVKPFGDADATLQPGTSGTVVGIAALP